MIDLCQKCDGSCPSATCTCDEYLSTEQIAQQDRLATLLFNLAFNVASKDVTPAATHPILAEALLLPPGNRLFAAAVGLSMQVIGLTDKDVAHEFSCSRPTVGRWCNGMGAPHPFMRPHVFEWFLKKLQEAT